MRRSWAGAVLGLALSGCGGSGYTELAKNRDRWDRQRPATYAYRYEETGFTPVGGEPWTVVVSGFDVTTVTYAIEGSPPSGVTLSIGDAHTIDELFGQILQALDSSVEVTATYDAKLGYPGDVIYGDVSFSDRAGFKASDLEAR